MELIRQQAIAIVNEDIGLGICNAADYEYAVESMMRTIIELDNRY